MWRGGHSGEGRGLHGRNEVLPLIKPAVAAGRAAVSCQTDQNELSSFPNKQRVKPGQKRSGSYAEPAYVSIVSESCLEL